MEMRICVAENDACHSLPFILSPARKSWERKRGVEGRKRKAKLKGDKSLRTTRTPTRLVSFKKYKYWMKKILTEATTIQTSKTAEKTYEIVSR